LQDKLSAIEKAKKDMDGLVRAQSPEAAKAKDPPSV
jgi:hypothetical protein